MRPVHDLLHAVSTGPLHGPIGTAIGAIRESLPTLSAVATLAALGWFLTGRTLRGRTRTLWLCVPCLALVAAICIIGPGRLFPKVPWEGPSLIRLSHRHALTTLDVPGLACATCALALGAILVTKRLAEYRR